MPAPDHAKLVAIHPELEASLRRSRAADCLGVGACALLDEVDRLRALQPPEPVLEDWVVQTTNGPILIKATSQSAAEERAERSYGYRKPAPPASPDAAAKALELADELDEWGNRYSSWVDSAIKLHGAASTIRTLAAECERLKGDDSKDTRTWLEMKQDNVKWMTSYALQEQELEKAEADRDRLAAELERVRIGLKSLIETWKRLFDVPVPVRIEELLAPAPAAGPEGGE